MALYESDKKGKFVTKIFFHFQTMLNKVLESCKCGICSKTVLKQQEIKEFSW